MNNNGKRTGSDASSKLPARLRISGVIVLLVGIIGAGILYWIGTRTEDLRDNPMMTGYYRLQSRQVEQLIGKMGLVFVDLLDDLKRPENQALVVGAVSIVIAFGCFYIAELLESNENDNSGFFDRKDDRTPRE
jgi:hypothetical protein